MPGKVFAGSPKVSRLIGIVFLLMGAGLLALAWRLTRQEPLSEAGNPYVLGLVEQIDRRVYLTSKRNSSGYQDTASRYVMRVRFTPAGGDSELVEVGSPAGQPPRYRVGEVVTMECPRGYPAEAVLADHPGQRRKPVLLELFGLVGVGLGLAGLLPRRASR